MRSVRKRKEKPIVLKLWSSPTSGSLNETLNLICDLKATAKTKRRRQKPPHVSRCSELATSRGDLDGDGDVDINFAT